MSNEQADKPNAFHVGSMKFEAGQVYVDDAGNKYVVSSAVSSTASPTTYTGDVRLCQRKDGLCTIPNCGCPPATRSSVIDDIAPNVKSALQAASTPSAIERQPKCLLCGATSEAGCMKIPCPLAARSSMNELEDQRGNLAMLVRTLVHALRRHDKASGPADRAMAYLCSKGLQGSILRDAHDDISSADR